MDRPLQRSARIRLRAARLPWLVLAALVIGVVVFFVRRGGALRVPRDQITISRVSRGSFEDFLPLTGEVVPPQTILLDAVEGGRVERILVEDGAEVKAGQLLVQLSNPAIQLDVISREAQVTEQMNNLRNTELALEQARLQQERERVELEYRLKQAATAADRMRALAPQGVVAPAELEDAEADRRYFARRLEVLHKGEQIDERLRSRQLAQLQESSTALQENLAFAHRHLEHLEVRAPVDGTLTALDVHVGQSVALGERLGQVDLHGAFKIAAKVDQFYAGRVAIGQRARLTADGREHQLEVTKIYPHVEAGRFTIDLAFRGEGAAGDVPASLRRGQTLQLRLTIGETTETLLLPNGAFAERTAGRWVYRVADGRAVRRAVELGRRNPQYIEVLGGLAAGDQVITSSYDTFTEAEALDLEP